MHGIVGDDTEGSTLDAQEPRDHAGAEFRPELEKRVCIRNCFDNGPDIVGPFAAFRNQAAQFELIAFFPGCCCSLKIGKILFG